MVADYFEITYISVVYWIYYLIQSKYPILMFLQLNSNSTRLSIIDHTALLYILDLDKVVDDEQNVKERIQK